jgi:transposase
MGRAIVRDPQVFLFDEPLSSLDAKLRVAMRAEVRELHQRLKATTVYVTHDQIEAMTMADKIVAMHDGIVEQVGTPIELFDRPRNVFVAAFIGSPSMNLVVGADQWDGRPHLSGIAMCQSVGVFTNPLEQTGASDMKVTTLGIDLAKNVFQVHGIDQHGKEMLKKQLKRAQMVPFFINLPPCLIGMEACGSAHHWARKLQAMGHTVRLMAPQFVKPYVKTNKNDAADAEAICEAVGRPNMRFVPVKNVEQQAVLALHRVRQGFVKARTAQGNQIRGLLAEFGIIIPQGISNIASRVPELIEDASNELPGAFRVLVQRLLDHLKELDRQVDELEAQIQAWHRNNDLSTKIAQVPGIGPISASALVAAIGDAKSFDNGRQLAAWLGLVPKQHSTGGRSNLLSISKRGDTYLRTLLIHGARSVIYHAAKKPESCTWVSAVVSRRNKNVAAVALANKNARIVWALLAHDRRYETGYTRAVEIA